MMRLNLYQTVLIGVYLLLANSMFAQVFKGESVEYDPIGKRFLTSDDGVSIVQRAYNGTISYFGQGLKASYGMEVMNGKLFAVEGGSVYVYDLQTETQVQVIPISGAVFLNGLAADGNSRLWVTDFSAGKIHQIDVTNLATPVVTQIVATYGGQPNGIVYDGANNRLVVVSWGASAKIKAVNLNDYSVTTLVTTALSNIDGVDLDGFGNFYICSWSPDKIVRYTNDFTQSTDFIPAGLNNPADICYVNSTDTLAIPSSATTSVLFLVFSPVSTTVQPDEALSATLYPNPLGMDSRIHFTLTANSTVSYKMTDIKGSVICENDFKTLKGGEHSIPLCDFNATKGVYFCTLTIGGKTQTFKVIKE